ncbi:unnamed protein product [Closterium sp. NIES-54]
MRSLRTAQALYNVVIARYSSPATATLGRLLLPFLFPKLSAFATVENLVSHLCTSDSHYRAAAPAEFLERNQPPMFITLYFIVTRLPESLRSVRDHFLSLDPTVLSVDLGEQHLLAAETSVVAVGAARGTPRTPFFEGCYPSPLAQSYASAAAVHVLGAKDVGDASASAKRSISKGKGSRGGEGGSGSSGGGSRGGSGGSGGGGSGGSGGGSGGVSGGDGGSGGSRGGRTGAQRGGSGGGQSQWQQRRSETPSPQQLREWLFQRGASGGLEAAALGGSESSLPGTAPTEALHTFTLDSGASRCFFRDSTTLTPLPAPVPVRLADPFGVPVVARSSTVLPCQAVPFGSLSSLHLPSFSTNLVSTAALQDSMVTTTTPRGQHVSIFTCTRTGRHLATFTRRPGSSLYTLATEPPQVAASAQVSASGQVAPPCSCRLLSHQTLLWHHHLGHPSLPRLRGMHTCLIVSGLPRSLPPLPPSPAPPCLPCIERQQSAAPQSSSSPPTTAPLQTLHIDVKGQVIDVLIPWIRAIRLQLLERFHADLPLQRLHSDRGGEFSSNLLREFCRGEGILQSFTLPDSPQQNGISEHRIGQVIEPRVSLPETSPILRWTGKVGNASMFRVWGSHAFIRDTSADKLSASAIPCVFLGFVPDALGWQFYHPTSSRVFPSQDITFDESVPFYRLFPYRSAPPPPPPLFLAQGPPPDAGSGGAEPGGAEPGGSEPGGAVPEGVEPRGGESEGAESGGTESLQAASSRGPIGASPRLSPRREPLSPQQLREWLVRRTRPRSGAAGAGAYGDTGAGGSGVTAGASGTRGTATAGPGGARTKGTGAARTGGVGGTGARDPMEHGAAGAGGVGAGGTSAGAGGAGAGGTGAGAGGAGAGGPGAGGAGVEGAKAVDPGAGGAGAGGAGGTGARGTMRPRPYFVPLLHQVLGALLLLALLLPCCVHRLTSRCCSCSRPPHSLILLRTMSRLADLQSVVSLRLVLSYLFALLVAFLVRILLLSRSLFLRTDTLLPPFYILIYVDDLIFATAYTEALTLSTAHHHPDSVIHGAPGSSMLRLPLLLATAHSSVYQPLALSSTLDESVEPSGMYPELVGCLMYLMTCTQPDLAYLLSLLARYLAPARHQKVHWDAAKRVLRYLCCNSGMGLVLGGRGPVVLTSHADASWIDDSATQRTSQGYTFSLGSGSVS